MWLLLGLFIILKLMVFHKLKDLHFDFHVNKLCPNGYHGLVPDPYDCNSYFLCPSRQQFYCDTGEQFDLDEHKCVFATLESGCVGRLYKNLLL
ncbi:ac145 [Peridroma alphabaculovirus]|uniref:Ac145 n=1 Tax=Peridroma alphabaculovirus TaxID=1346829 RepID=A0A068LL35_9ABAC|nr:ac145 [Peridroma alphabaculovirus]AIE47858.1 ac145 [Peridroma alphabaculovirus]